MATAGFTSHQLDDAALRGTIKDAFRVKIDKAAKVWKKCGFEEDKTEKPFEEYTSFSGLGLAGRREEFQQVMIDTPKQNYTRRLNLLEFAIMTGVSDTVLRFIRKGQMAVRNAIQPMEMVAESIAKTNEVMAADVFGNAFDTNFTGNDAVPLVSASHKLGRGGTQTNYLGAVSFVQESIENGLIQADGFKDDVGLPVGCKPGKRILVIPRQYRFKAKRILKSEKHSENANNAINALMDEELAPQVNIDLPSTSNWFIVNTGEKQGLHAIFETEPTTREFGEEKVHAMWFECYEMVVFDFGLNYRRVQGSDF